MLAETLLITYIPIAEKLPDKIDLTRCMAFKSKSDHNQCPCRHRPGSRFCGKHAQTKQEILINGARRSARQTLISTNQSNQNNRAKIKSRHQPGYNLNKNIDNMTIQNNKIIQTNTNNNHLPNLIATIITIVKDPHLTRLNSRQIHDNFIFYQLNKYLINEITTEKKRQLLIRFLRLLARIHNLDPQHTKIRFLQRIVRKFLPTRIRAWNSGPGALGPANMLCINKEDFFNLDPLDSIPRRFLFTYKAGDGFIYGFSIFSFIDLCTTSQSPENPYTREIIDKQIINRALRFWHTLESWSAFDPEIKKYQNERLNQNENNTNNRLGNQQPKITLKMRNKMRLSNVFKKIDYLGYHTNPEWLFEKPAPILINFIKAIARNWSFQMGISEITKNNILASANIMQSFESLVNFAYKWSPTTNMTTPSQQLILCWIIDVLEAFINNSHDQNTGALLILYSLYYIEPRRVVMANTWMN